MLSIIGTYQNGYLKLEDDYTTVNLVKVIVTFLEEVQEIKETINPKDKIIDSHDEISMSYAPTEIDFNNKRYILNSPLRCLFEKEEDYFIIQSEMLDIIGTGETKEDAELAFKQ